MKKKRGKIKGKNKEEGRILTSQMFKDNVKEEVKEPEIDQSEYDELYPDYAKEEPQKEVAEIVEETKRVLPISEDIKIDIYNRLVGIQNIANEEKMGKFKKIIMLAEECINMLDMNKEEEEKDE